jgi:ribonuclease III
MTRTPDADSAAPQVSELETLLGYSFRDRSLLINALTHRSYVNEHETEGLRHNESLEFLGDAVLGFLISARIYSRFPGLTEGELSKIKSFLVSAANLVQQAEKLRLGDYMRLSHGEEKTGGRKKKAILADACEALLAAVFLDGGIKACGAVLDALMADTIDRLDLSQFTYGDFKSALQEQLHELGRSEPGYRVVDEIGPDHRKVFVVQVVVDEQVVSEGTGRTKKEAQQEAARIALENLKS